jgi:ABC-type transport system substrate-binding protein
MKNYTYNGLNAHDIANKIIEKEERYLSIDFDTLSFEDKCRYVAHHNGIYHPLFRNGRNTEELKTEIMPALIRRSEAGDVNAMFYLCMFHPDVAHRSEEHKSMVERAMKMGSYEARIYYAGWFCREDNDKAYELLDEVLNETERSARVKKLVELEKILADDCPAIALVQYTNNYLASSDLKGLETSPYGYTLFTNATLKKYEEKNAAYVAEQEALEKAEKAAK